LTKALVLDKVKDMKNIEDKKTTPPKSSFPAMEEEVLNFWEKNKIFEKSMERPPLNLPLGKGEKYRPRLQGRGKEYVFYDGPPFATGTPHYGHIVASIMKDVVPRYWTMKGYRVERKWGWDCHGLPIENIVEKEMKTKSKKDIEEIGIDKFNEACRSKVLTYVDEWKKVIRRLGRWADMDNAYKTMDKDYMESIWWVFKELYDKGLIYEGYKSMHICPRCETTLSQQEVAEGYKEVKDLSATVKFKLNLDNITDDEILRSLALTQNDKSVYILAWTTTPWTLIGNVALAVGESIKYLVLSIKGEQGKYILAKDRTEEIMKGREYEILSEIKGEGLIGLEYEPLFDYYSKDKNLSAPGGPASGWENIENGWKIYAGDFVTTEEGTGVVHIAPAFGEDDMNLGKQENLPFIQHIGMDGRIKEEAKDFAGLEVKPIEDEQATDVEIIKYLAKKDLLFSKEKYEHSYPHCWRCDTPLLNYATSSWFVKVEAVKEQAIKLAEKINWTPKHIKEGRFGQWLEGARDWSISRQRFWASAIPIWKCGECGELKVIGSVAELEKLSNKKITDLHKHIVDEITFKCEQCGGMMRRVPDVLDCWFESGSMPYAQTHYPFENKEKFENNFPAEFIAEGVDQTRAWFYYLHVIATAIKKKPAFKNVIVNGIVLAEDGKKMAKRLQNYPDPSLIMEKYGADALRYYLTTAPVMLAENLNFSEKGVQEALRKVSMLLWNVFKFYEIYTTHNAKRITHNAKDKKNILDQWILARLNQLITEVTEQMDEYNLVKAARPIEDFINDLSTWYIRRSRDRFKSDDAADKEAVLATTKFVLENLAKVMAPFTPFIAETIWQKVTGNDFKDENKSVHLENWPTSHNAQRITQNTLEEMKIVRKIVELGLAKRDEAGIKVRQPLNKFSIFNFQFSINTKEYEELIKDELNVKEIICKGGKGELSVELDTNITPELKQEGIKRELVRTINNLRKEAGMTIQDRAMIYYQTDSKDIKEVFKKFGAEIKKETLANSLLIGDGEEVKINGEEVELKVVKN